MLEMKKFLILLLFVFDLNSISNAAGGLKNALKINNFSVESSSSSSRDNKQQKEENALKEAVEEQIEKCKNNVTNNSSSDESESEEEDDKYGRGRASRKSSNGHRNHRNGNWNSYGNNNPSNNYYSHPAQYEPDNNNQQKHPMDPFHSNGNYYTNPMYGRRILQTSEYQRRSNEYDNFGREGNEYGSSSRGRLHGGFSPGSSRFDYRPSSSSWNGNNDGNDQCGNSPYEATNGSRNKKNRHHGASQKKKFINGGIDESDSEELENNDCLSQCIFDKLQLLDDEKTPSESMFIKWLQEHITDNDLERIKSMRIVRKCFARLSITDITDPCDLSKALVNCLHFDVD